MDDIMVKVITLAILFVWIRAFLGLGQAGTKAVRKTIEWGQKRD